MTEPRPTADDQQRAARRDSLRNLLDRLQRMGLTETEAHLLRQHVEAETRDADTARAVARSNLRHVQQIVPELERAEAAIARVRTAADKLADGTEDGFRAALAIREALDEPRPAPTSPAALVEVRDPCPRCEDCPLIPRHEMAQHQRDHHPETLADDDLANYTAPDPPIGCITLTQEPTP